MNEFYLSDKLNKFNRQKYKQSPYSQKLTASVATKLINSFKDDELNLDLTVSR